MAVIREDFVASGPPLYLMAFAGVKYLDIQTGIRYVQRTIPYGKVWIEESKQQVFVPPKGTVESVTASVTGAAMAVTSAPVTESGAIDLVFTGSGTQYVKGDGSLGLGVDGVTATAPISSSGGTTPNISIPQASATQDGYLSAADFITFSTGGGFDPNLTMAYSFALSCT